MGMDQFPMFRLATLLMRQLSSPIATRIKSYATRHPVFRRALIVRTGRAYRAVELRFKMWMLRLGRPPRSPPLSENEATQVGADLIGEMIIFSLGAGIITFEVNRQAVNKELKELEERSRWVAILVGLEELQREVALQQDDLDRLLAALRELAPHATLPPPLPRLDPAPQPDVVPSLLPKTSAPALESKLPQSKPIPPPKSLEPVLPSDPNLVPSLMPKSSDPALESKLPHYVPTSSLKSSEPKPQDDASPAPAPVTPQKRRPPHC